MANNKKSAKGNKTAHVLNLLTAPDAPTESAPASEEVPAEAAAGQAAPAASSRPLLPPILEVASSDDNLAQQIQHALEEELEEDLGGAAGAAPAAEQPARPTVEQAPPVAAEPPAKEQTPAAPAPPGGSLSKEDIEDILAEAAAPPEAPAPEPPPKPEPAPASSADVSGGNLSKEEIETILAEAAAPAEAPVPDPAPEPDPEPVPAPPAAEPAPQPQPPEEEEEDVSYTNIMQVLVEEKAPRYIEKFGLCTCKHCAADVKALTLSNLVPKYVVLSKMDRVPMLTVYEGRFSSSIFAQLTRACKIVMDHPHHKREG